jgi:alginate O-acetyltransferase complex protein AlgJ
MAASLRTLVLTVAVVSALWPRIVESNRALLARMEAFERRLEDEAIVGQTLRPYAQRLLTGWLGAGNERVYPGRDGWLYYRPDVEYVTGRGFLEPAVIARRMAQAAEWTEPPAADPRPALAQLKRQLDARGIVLVVMPTPVKPAIHPEMLARGSPAPMHNASYAAFIQAIEADGLVVFDPSDALAAARRAGPQYLKTDTHWRPEAMELAAERLAALMTARRWLPGVADPGYHVERIEVRNAGDTARMLDLPDGDPLVPFETVWIRRVLHADGSPWRSAREADVLVLGDSFSNVYALESMGWGTAAGFVEHLSYVLRRPVDRLVQNDQGAFATREMLARSPDRLAGKRVVIYQFAARELAFGDWRLLPD